MANENLTQKTNVDYLLKYVYAGAPVENALKGPGMIKRHAKFPAAGRAVKVVQAVDGLGPALMTSEGGEFHAIGKSEFDEMEVTLQPASASIQVTTTALTVARQSPEKALDFVEREIKNLRGAFELMLRWYFCGRGDAYVTTVVSVAGSVLTVKDASLFRPGMYVQAHDSRAATANETMAANLITAVDRLNGTITVTTVSSAAGGNFLSFKGQRSATAYAVPVGVAGGVDDGTYQGTIHGKTRSSTYWANAHVDGNAGVPRQFEMALLDDMFADIEADCAGDKETLGKIYMLLHPALNKAITKRHGAAAMVTRTHDSNAAVQFNGGTLAWKYQRDDGATVDRETDYYVDEKELYLVNKAAMGVAHHKDVQFLDGSDGIWMPGRDTTTIEPVLKMGAYAWWHLNFIWKGPFRHMGRIGDLSAPAPTTRASR